MVKPGEVVIVDFPGALGVKRCPAIVISIDTYHTIRPDVILGLLTTQTAGATRRLMDYILQDWSTTDLHSISDFRAFLPTLLVKKCCSDTTLIEPRLARGTSSASHCIACDIKSDSA